VGTLGFVFWQNFVNKPAEKSTEQTTTSESPESTSASEGSLAIKEWGLQAAYNKDTLSTLTYDVVGNKLTFSSSVVNDEILPCAGLSADAWGIARAQAGDKDIFGNDVTDSWTKIGTSYYNRLYPQSGCEIKADKINLIDGAYSDLFKKLVQSN